MNVASDPIATEATRPATLGRYRNEETPCPDGRSGLPRIINRTKAAHASGVDMPAG
jgi:hypothetical protein